ncbi:hypothetical protein SLNWT_1798 [Streptomyces albus]|uniref:Uncharacterized protein n=1 Tax=Streptomyces albus (strain ATCC 21838 / DSM 41398 / FERM P-419 / JCM 4703 / NBRC 107858) TaxID=1081613 RepID=A0A0B5EKX1_STRA4|nr:hypothetical protein SLNWT_1798 [Streptomyces albus]AOU76489.1 hypothetical protein SLNHY_1798 [Streptomyces albus]
MREAPRFRGPAPVPFALNSCFWGGPSRIQELVPNRIGRRPPGLDHGVRHPQDLHVTSATESPTPSGELPANDRRPGGRPPARIASGTFGPAPRTSRGVSRYAEALIPRQRSPETESEPSG